MLNEENRRILGYACDGIREANRCLTRGQAYTASRCCREADGRIVFVASQSDVEIAEVNDYVKKYMAR